MSTAIRLGRSKVKGTTPIDVVVAPAVRAVGARLEDRQVAVAVQDPAEVDVAEEAEDVLALRDGHVEGLVQVALEHVAHLEREGRDDRDRVLLLVADQDVLVARIPGDAARAAPDGGVLDHLVEARGARVDVDEADRVRGLVRDRQEVEVRRHREVGRVPHRDAVEDREAVRVQDDDLAPRAVDHVQEVTDLLADHVVLAGARVRQAGAIGAQEERVLEAGQRSPEGGTPLFGLPSGTPGTSRLARPRPPWSTRSAE